MATFSKPTRTPRWADTGITLEPPEAKKDSGWLFEEEPSSSFENDRANLVGLWFKWIDERFLDDPDANTIALADPAGGANLASFNNAGITLSRDVTFGGDIVGGSQLSIQNTGGLQVFEGTQVASFATGGIALDRNVTLSSGSTFSMTAAVLTVAGTGGGISCSGTLGIVAAGATAFFSAIGGASYLVNSTGGLNVSGTGDITQSGTGDIDVSGGGNVLLAGGEIKHQTLELVLAVGGGTWHGGGNFISGEAVAEFSSDIFLIGIPLKVGDRITEIHYGGTGSDTSSKTFSIRTRDLTDGSLSTKGSSTITTSGDYDNDIGISAFTIGADEVVYFQWEVGAATDVLVGIQVKFERL